MDCLCYFFSSLYPWLVRIFGIYFLTQSVIVSTISTIRNSIDLFGSEGLEASHQKIYRKLVSAYATTS